MHTHTHIHTNFSRIPYSFGCGWFFSIFVPLFGTTGTSFSPSIWFWMVFVEALVCIWQQYSIYWTHCAQMTFHYTQIELNSLFLAHSVCMFSIFLLWRWHFNHVRVAISTVFLICHLLKLLFSFFRLNCCSLKFCFHYGFTFYHPMGLNDIFVVGTNQPNNNNNNNNRNRNPGAWILIFTIEFFPKDNKFVWTTKIEFFSFKQSGGFLLY